MPPTPTDPSTRPPATRGVVLCGAVVAIAAGGLLALPLGATASWLVVLVGVWLGGVIWALRRPVLPLGFLALEVWAGLNVVAGAVVAVTTGVTLLGTYDLTPGTADALGLWAVALGALWAGAVVATVLEDDRVVTAPKNRPSMAEGTAAGSPSAPDHPAPLPVTVPAPVLDRWALTCLVLGVASLVAYVVASGASFGALNVFAGETVYGDLGSGEGATAVGLLKAMAGLAGVAIVLVVVRLTADRRVPLVPVLVATASVVVLGAPGGRARLVVPVAIAVLVWLRTSRSSWAARPRRLVVVGAAVLFGFAAVVGGLRGQTDKELDLGAAVAKEARGGVFPASAGLVATVPDRQPELGVAPVVDALVLVVPRAVWADKPASSLVDVQVAIFGQNIGASFALPGELWAAGGWVAVAVGVALVGGAAEVLWRRLRAGTDLGRVLLAATALVLLVQGFSRGNLAGQVAGAAGVVIGMWVVARRTRRWSAGAADASAVGTTGGAAPLEPRPVRA